MATDTLDKVRKLIQLSASANLKEAERAAYKACAMIRTHGLDVCNPDEIDAIYQQVAAGEQKIKELEAGRQTDDDDDIVSLTGVPGPQSGRYPSAQQASRPTRYASYATAQAKGPVAAGQPVYTAAPAQQPPMTTPVQMPSKYAGFCKQCKHAFQAGTVILWMKGSGSWCGQNCYALWSAAHKGVQGWNP